MNIKLRFWLTTLPPFTLLAFCIAYGFRNQHLILFCSELLLVLLAAGIAYSYRQVIRPVQTLRNGINLLNEQEFSSQLCSVGQKDVDQLVLLYNRMMLTLKEERLRVHEKHHLLEQMVKASPMGVVMVDGQQNISSLNPAAQRLLAVPCSYRQPLQAIGTPLASEMAKLRPNEERIVKINGVHSYKCSRSYFIDSGHQHTFFLVEELTHELLKTEKKAYEKVIRVMAHEVNNAIGATNSMLTLLNDSVKSSNISCSDEFCSVISIATERGQSLSHLMNNFSEVVRIPEPKMAQMCIGKLVDAIRLPLDAQCRKRNICLQIDIPNPAPVIMADIVQLGQVLENILKNSLEAIGSDGHISISVTSSPASITISDNGKGLDACQQELIFSPFYTTKPSGQGIGLMFVREILMNHGFAFSLQTNDSGITEFTIRMG